MTQLIFKKIGEKPDKTNIWLCLDVTASSPEEAEQLIATFKETDKEAVFTHVDRDLYLSKTTRRKVNWK